MTHPLHSNSSRFVTTLLATIALLLVTSCYQNAPEQTPVLNAPPNTALPMPPLNPESVSELGWALLQINGSNEELQRAKISDYRGKVLVLDLYATWCAPCRESIPRLKEIQQRYREKGLHVVGLNVGGPDDRVKVADFARELDIQYPLGFPDKALSELLLSDDQSIPQTFVFDRDGKVVKRFIGYDSTVAETLEKLIETEAAKDSTR